MNFIFNELSIKNVANNSAHAHSWLNNFFKLCIEAGNRSNKIVFIVSTVKFSKIYYHQDTSFAIWMATINDVDLKRKILSTVTKEPIRIDYPYYYHNGHSCQGLGYAYETENIAVSYGSEYWLGSVLPLTREQFNNAEQVEMQTLSVKHISSSDHLDVYFPVRKFIPNPKHDKIRPIANKGEEVSILDCSTKDAYELLCYALGENTPNDKQLYYYDKNIKKFIIFYRHDIALNEYHAYHTNNEIEIPPTVLKALKIKYNL